jgi:hypothetical protein
MNDDTRQEQPSEQKKPLSWLAQLPLWLTALVGFVTLVELLREWGPSADKFSRALVDQLTAYSAPKQNILAFLWWPQSACRGDYKPWTPIVEECKGYWSPLLVDIKKYFAPTSNWSLQILMMVGSFALFIPCALSRILDKGTPWKDQIANDWRAATVKLGFPKAVLATIGIVGMWLVAFLAVFFPLYASILKYSILLVIWLFGVFAAAVFGFCLYLVQFFIGVKALAVYLEIYHGGAAAKELYADARLVSTLRRAIGLLRR